jgi:hypothetical protein
MQQSGFLKSADQGMMRLLRSLAYGDVSGIKPRIGQDVRYPLVEDITRTSKERSREILQQLYEQGYLDRRIEAKVYRCPHDNTASIRPRLSCPRCNSEALEKHPLLEHISCGHVDLEKNFLSGQGYVCPKDHGPLRQIGVDYRKAGMAYKCSSCGNLTPLPVERWVCNASDHVFSLEEAVSEDVYSYQLVEEKYDEVKQALRYVDPLAETLRRHAYLVETFADVVGASGITHSVDIYARTTTSNPREAVVVSVLTGEATKPENVIGIYCIVLDTSPKMAILVSIPKLNEESKFYAQKLGMTVIEGDDIAEASQQLDLFLQNHGDDRPLAVVPFARAAITSTASGPTSVRLATGTDGHTTAGVTTDSPFLEPSPHRL